VQRIGWLIVWVTSWCGLVAQTKVYYALWVGFFICIASLASTIWCFFIDRSAEKRILANQQARGAVTGLPIPEKEEINLWAVKSFPVFVLCVQCHHDSPS
jgi:hypothetical protein